MHYNHVSPIQTQTNYSVNKQSDVFSKGRSIKRENRLHNVVKKQNSVLILEINGKGRRYKKKQKMNGMNVKQSNKN